MGDAPELACVGYCGTTLFREGYTALVRDPADAEANIAWTRGLAAAIAPFGTGGIYVNDAYEQRPSAAYGANYDRLVEIKTAYDPTNFSATTRT